MNTAAQQEPSESREPLPRNPCESLVFAIREIARGAGYAIEYDSLSIALGLPWLTCAVPTEPDVGMWPMYARDAFVIQAGRLFGMTIRGIHPPEAARGLNSAAEFRQHFHASYRPLVKRALEHDQPVLAWRGWPGDREPQWGIIRADCDTGFGFTGTTMSADDAPTAADSVPLDGPPIQLYVVETITPRIPGNEELICAAFRHALLALSGDLNERLGVVMGPAAYAAWIERLEEKTATGQGAAVAAAGHSRLATSVNMAHRAAVRFLTRCADRTAPVDSPLLDTLLGCSREIAAALDSLVSESAAKGLATTIGRDEWRTHLAHARAATTNALTALQAYACRQERQ